MKNMYISGEFCNSMKTSRLFFLLITIQLVAGSCLDEVPLAPIKSGSVRNFPNALGSSWTYHVTDNLQPVDSIKPVYIIDTVNVSIDRYAIDPQTNLSAAVWNYVFTSNSSNQNPEKPVVIKGDTVYMYWNWNNGDKIGLIFPFEIRDSWRTGGILSGDKTTVLDTTSMTLGAGRFDKVFVLQNERRTSISTDSRVATLWFVPDFGIIKMHFHEEHQLSEGDTTWLLVDHNNPNF